MEAKRGSAEAAPAKFTVTAVDQDGGGICYYLVPDGKAAANLWDVDHIHLPKSSGPHILQFALDDKTSGKKLSLRGTDPFDCADDHPCPPPGGINSSQISLSGNPSGNIVTIKNLNSGSPVDIRYQLNYEAGGISYPCDPIIKNDGG